MNCPRCKATLSPRASSCGDCGWRAANAPAPTAASQDDQANRCTYVSNHVRCRNIGSATDAHGIGPLFCSAHWSWGRHDPIEGQRIVEASVNAVPENFDYSSESIVRLTREQYRKGVVPRAPMSTRDTNEFVRKHPNVAAQMGLHQRRIDVVEAEADAERDAIQGEAWPEYQHWQTARARANGR